MEKKSTLRVYTAKETIGGVDHFWDNSRGSALLFKARSDSLELARRKFRWTTSDSDVCQVCSLQTSETITHFLLECPCYADRRQSYLKSQYGSSAALTGLSDDCALQRLLFETPSRKNQLENASRLKRFLENMWDLRKQTSLSLLT